VTIAASPAYNQVVTGVLGFLVVAGMGVALFFLLRSMNKHLRKVVTGPRWREEAKQQATGQDSTPLQNGSRQP
jgi:large-conductance mechanosensitive channel